MTNIEWTEKTWNPLRARRLDSGKEGWHCELVSPGCSHCYAAKQNKNIRGLRFGTGLEYVKGSRSFIETYLHEKTLVRPLSYREPHKIFVCSMTDLFGEWVADEQIDRVFAVMALTPQHTYQVLTKRPERMKAYLTARDLTNRVIDAAFRMDCEGGAWMNCDHHIGGDQIMPLPNVWLGVSAEDQKRADDRIPLLLQTPAAVRFVSAEPLLGSISFEQIAAVGSDEPIDVLRQWTWLQEWENAWKGTEGDETTELESMLDFYGLHSEPSGVMQPKIDWVIVGGESGANARPFDPEWARSIQAQCRAADVAFFGKQWDKKRVLPGDLMVRQFPGVPLVNSQSAIDSVAEVTQ